MKMYEVYDLHKNVMDEIGITRKDCEYHLTALVESKFLIIGDDGTLYFTIPETGAVVGTMVPD